MDASTNQTDTIWEPGSRRSATKKEFRGFRHWSVVLRWTHLREEARFRQISSSVDPVTVSGKRPAALRFKPKRLRAAFSSPSCLGACLSFRDVAALLPVVYVLLAGNVASSVSSHTAKRPTESRQLGKRSASRILAPIIVLRTRTPVSRSSDVHPISWYVPRFFFFFVCFRVLAELLTKLRQFRAFRRDT